VVYQLYVGYLLCKKDALQPPRVAIDLSAAVVIGFLGAYLKADGAIGFLAGLAALFAIETYRMIPLVEKIYHQYEAANTLLKQFEAPDKFSEILLLHGLKDLGQLSQSSISVNKDDVREFWRDCLARANIKWSVLTYALPDDTWGISSWSRRALAIQQERIVSNCTIERVFIFDDVNEKDRLQPIMEHHSGCGIKVFWLLKPDLLANRTANDCLKIIGSLDVAVVDDSWVYMTSLDEQRNMVGAKATKSARIVQLATLLINEAQALATEKGNIVQVMIGGDNSQDKALVPKIQNTKLADQSKAEFSPGTTAAEFMIQGENLTGAVLSSASELISFEKTSEVSQYVGAKISVSPDAHPGEYELKLTTSAGAAQTNILVKHKDAPANLSVYESADARRLESGKDGMLQIAIIGSYLKGATAAIEPAVQGLTVNVVDNSNDNQLRANIAVSGTTPSGNYTLKVTNQSGKDSSVTFKVDRF
jgi:hypothetical protein